MIQTTGKGSRAFFNQFFVPGLCDSSPLISMHVGQLQQGDFIVLYPEYGGIVGTIVVVTLYFV